MSYYVGGTQQFTHSETADGTPISQQLGRWSVSDPSVASITTSGLATWLAPGECEIMFTIADYSRVGARHVVVHSVAPDSLASAPSSLSLVAGSLAKLAISALDIDAHAITDFEIDSATSDDDTIAEVLMLEGTDLLVLAAAAGTCTITIVSDAAEVTVAVSVGAASGGGGGAVSSVFTRIGAVVKQAGDYAVADITGAATAASVTSEASTRAAADGTLQSHIDSEATTRATDDATLAAAIVSEGSTRASADTTLQGNITSEATTRAAADSTESTARASADTTLQGNIDAEAAARVAADAAEVTARNSAIATAVANVINAAPGALDTLKELADAIGDDPNFAATLTGLVSTEAAARAAADTTLQTNITAEATARSGADTTEAAARAAADTTLQTNITAEATTRDAADTAEASTRASADTTLQSNITAEASTRATADALKAPLASPALTGHPTGVTEAPLDASTRLSTTAYTDAAVAVETAARAAAVSAEATARTSAISAAVSALVNSAPGTLDTLGEIATALAADESGAAALATTVATKAPLASPALTGAPTAPTAAPLDNTTKIATTAYSDAAVAVEAAARAAADTTESAARVAADALLAPLASPGFTGNHTVPTQAPSTNNTRAASTAYADAAVALEAVARAAAISALSFAPLASPAFTGHPTGVTEAPLTNSTRLATTAYADLAVAALKATAWTHPDIAPVLASVFPTLGNSPTLTDYTDYGLGLTGAAGGTIIRYAVKPLTGDLTVITRVITHIATINSSVGVIVRDSVGGKCYVIGPTNFSSVFQILSMLWTTSSSGPANNIGNTIPALAVWLKVTYTASNKHIDAWFSIDGKTWFQNTVANTTVAAPDQIGIYVWSTDTTGAPSGIFTYWNDGVNAGTPLKLVKG